MTVEEAAAFFRSSRAAVASCKTLLDVGLATSGSARTRRRCRAARRSGSSSRASWPRATGRTLYILDEPTTGLHFDDIEQLLGVLLRLRDAGNTVVVIEHNLDVIKTADWVIDLGPEGGDGGGHIVAAGTPEAIAATAGSHTGRYLAGVLGKAAPGGAARRTA